MKGRNIIKKKEAKKHYQLHEANEQRIGMVS